MANVVLATHKIIFLNLHNLWYNIRSLTFSTKTKHTISPLITTIPDTVVNKIDIPIEQF